MQHNEETVFKLSNFEHASVSGIIHLACVDVCIAYHVHYEKSLCTHSNLKWFLWRTAKRSF